MESIADARSLLAGLFEHSPVAFQVYRANGHCLLVNQAFRELMGSAPPPEYNVLEDDILESQGFLDLVRRAFAGETVRIPPHWYDPRELRQIEVREGRRVGIEVTLFPLRSESGELEYVALCIKDVTAELELRALRGRDARKAASLESALDASLTMDHRGQIVDFNPAAERTFGYSRAEALGKPLADLIIPESLRERHREGLRRYLESGKGKMIGKRIELQALRSNGTEFPAEVAVVPIPTDGPPLFAGYVRDLTERRRLEQQLRQAQKMEAVGRLAGGIAHDFNNMLTPIMSYVSLILNDVKPGDPIREDLLEVRKAAKRAQAVTQQLLAFSREKVVQPVPVDFSACVASMERLLMRVIGEHIDFSTGLQPLVDTVLIDAGEIEQVIMNLVLNARDAMPQGGRLRIETKNVKIDEREARENAGVEPGPHVMLAVIDTGTGMNAETQARIFDPFFTTKKSGKGTGLGLATVFAIVTKSRGRISVRSEPGKGTSFELCFPRHGGKPYVSGQHALALPIDRGSETILLVEDDDLVRGSARAILLRKGYAVLEANSGAEAIAISGRDTSDIDLLLTDVVMPNMGGRELADHLTRRRPRMKVIFMSGHTGDSELQRAVLESGVAFVQKPFTPEVLARHVREVLDQPVAKTEGGR